MPEEAPILGRTAAPEVVVEVPRIEQALWPRTDQVADIGLAEQIDRVLILIIARARGHPNGPSWRQIGLATKRRPTCSISRLIKILRGTIPWPTP